MKNDKRLKPNTLYAIGIETDKHKLISNIDKFISICGRGTTAASSTQKIPLKTSPGIFRSSGFGATPSPETEISESSTGQQEPYNYPAQAQTYSSGQPINIPRSAGSLVGRALPPPPQVAVADDDTEQDEVPEQERRMEPREIVVATMNLESAQAVAEYVAGMGFRVKRRRLLYNLGFVMTTLRTPEGMSSRQALKHLRSAMPKVWMDMNTRLRMNSSAQDPRRYGHRLVGWEKTADTCGAGIRIGIVDSAIDTSHPAFAGQRVNVKSVLSRGVRNAPKDHATAIVSILSGNPHQPAYAGLLPGAEIYSVSVFRLRGKDHVDTTAELVILALDWLASKQVNVINLSLGGPRNLILEAAIQRISDQGIIVVGAAGNNGPDSPPDYPGALDGVIAVTAVDANLKVYKGANRGDYITFSAPGVDVWAAKPGGKGSFVTGTSFAVPYVVAAVAMERIKDPDANFDTIVQRLKNNAKDLGEPDKDKVYGWGLIKMTLVCSAGVRS